MKQRRSPAAIGALGIVVALLATVSAFFLDDLPIIGAGATYRAQFTEAAGLKPSNEVRIAGVKVGKVTAVELDGDKVEVAFKVKDAWVGDQTTASIQIKTVLGQKYLALDPRGSDTLDARDTIPLERTTSPYDVLDAFGDATTTLDAIDTPQLAQSMKTLSEAFSETPADIRASLDGVTRLSKTIGSRDEELRKLFAATADTSKVLADRNAEFTKLIGSAGLLLGELNSRQQAISQLLTGTQRLSQQLTGLVKDNEAQIGPALEQLRGVVQILQDNNANLDRAIKLYAPFTRLYANIVGNGRWFDQVVVNLTPPALPLIPGYRDPVRTIGGN
ncbi:phospholipid/cholesterol/gamma-HCH transport system substrate-binding protein [Rhodococcus sp. PvR044]|uniref:MCE family protein n=1 Tax=Rhodococcus oryzae TaxID=2571143 RepID=A0ABY2RQD9_9NOCA|nr:MULTISPECIES: MCE family protein [Rhodococcus]MBP1162606.1 phospholipid/cholesterol/gamma-HCH transport system substrate-binding protein [Rhodococcus sp. PvR099]PTR43971.1 phospholipid/cholesterol/gamma-HCH transport system substrate-binding protein [Rhodococcus sp. OK611]TJZ79626.1 MCE family protein [Rhodococcus oryzae]SNX90273.1 phospholipid/cholesterol/gamma-HCH transport system substrate-binding protein [Rhodococcus sp. OK270]